METALRERQPVESKRDLVSPGAVPAERSELLRHVPEDNAVVVTQLQRDARRGDALLRLDEQTDEHRLAGRELRALLARVVDERGCGDPRLARAPLAQPGLELLRALLRAEEPSVRGDRFARRAVEGELSLPQQHGPVAQPLDRTRVVGDENDRAAAVLELGDLAEALPLKLLVTDRKHLVEKEHVGADVRSDGEPEPHEHPRRVRAHGQVDELLELRERHDLVHHLAHPRARQTVDRSVQVDVLAAGEVGMETRAELQERRDSAAGLHVPRGRSDDPGHDPQEGRLAGAVASDETDRLTRLDRHRDISQRLDVARSEAAARDEDVLQGALRLRVDAEGPRDAVDDDASRCQTRFSMCTAVSWYPSDRYRPRATALPPNTLSATFAIPRRRASSSANTIAARPRPRPRNSALISTA